MPLFEQSADGSYLESILLSAIEEAMWATLAWKSRECVCR